MLKTVHAMPIRPFFLLKCVSDAMLQIIVKDTVAFVTHLDLSISYYRGFDDEMRAAVARNLEGRGIDLHPQTNLTEVL